MILYDQELPGGYVDKKFIAEESDFELESGKGRRLAAIRCLRRAFLGVPVYDFKYRNPALTKYEMRDAEVICGSFGILADKLVEKMGRLIAGKLLDRRPGEYLAIRGFNQDGTDHFDWVHKSTFEHLLPDSEVQEPVPECKQKETNARDSRHWLLSTHRTRAHFGFDYSGEAFDYNRDWNKTPSTRTIYSLFAKTMFNVIIPNCLIAKEHGKRVTLKDVKEALAWVFRGHFGTIKRVFRETGRSPRDFKNDFIVAKYMHYVRDFIIDDDGHVTDRHSPEGKWWTLETYINKSKAKDHTVSKKKVYVRKNPGLEKLKEAFLANREIGSWDYRTIQVELKASRKNIAKFKELLRKRREKWGDSEGALF